MTRKHARAKFYRALRNIAPNYKWEIIGSAIRGRFKNPRDQKNTPFWPLFCPLTATHNGNQMRDRVKLSQFAIAGEMLDLDRKDITLIANSADNVGCYPNYYHPQVRATLLRCVGLSASPR